MLFCLLRLFLLLFLAWVTLTVNGHVCLLSLRWDESEQRDRWSMPSLERCHCQWVMKLNEPWSTQDTCGHLVPKNLEPKDVWFTDQPGPITDRGNWKPAILDQLLDRVEFCRKLGAFPERAAPSYVT